VVERRSGRDRALTRDGSRRPPQITVEVAQEASSNQSGFDGARAFD
jgi:hypothetical protein